MNKKVCVYAICKNESKFVDRWYESVKEADYIVVLDTGSEDNTVELLKNHNIIVGQKKIIPWRFDVARNESLKLIPEDTDICVCVDLDEFFEKGWREKLEKQWTDNTKRARYRYTWNFLEDGSEGVVFYIEKIHSYGDFFWKHPVHEVLETNLKNYETVFLEGVQLNHHADNSKSRGQYLPLLELSVKEDPKDDRNMHYLGREYMYYGKYNEAIKTLKKHLKLKTSTWNCERCASLRYIGNCYNQLQNYKNAEKYFKMAIIENPTDREPYYDLAKFYYEREKFLDCAFVIESMLNIKNRNFNYISNPRCWNYSVYDMLALCYFYLKNKEKALKNSLKAITLNPQNKRLINNHKFYEKMI